MKVIIDSKTGEVKVNGKVVTELGTKVSKNNVVEVDNVNMTLNITPW
mgnify:CR=1 FL=1